VRRSEIPGSKLTLKKTYRYLKNNSSNKLLNNHYLRVCFCSENAIWTRELEILSFVAEVSDHLDFF
jgi:hypothetical protein